MANHRGPVVLPVKVEGMSPGQLSYLADNRTAVIANVTVIFSTDGPDGTKVEVPAMCDIVYAWWGSVVQEYTVRLVLKAEPDHPLLVAWGYLNGSLLIGYLDNTKFTGQVWLLA